jgi:hypothetical protein
MPQLLCERIRSPREFAARQFPGYLISDFRRQQFQVDKRPRLRQALLLLSSQVLHDPSDSSTQLVIHDRSPPGKPRSHLSKNSRFTRNAYCTISMPTAKWGLHPPGQEMGVWHCKQLTVRLA